MKQRFLFAPGPETVASIAGSQSGATPVFSRSNTLWRAPTAAAMTFTTWRSPAATAITRPRRTGLTVDVLDVIHFLPPHARFRAIAHGRSLPHVSPSAVFVLSMAGGGRRVERTDPTGTQSVPRAADQGAGMDVTAPSRSPRRHCSPACRRRAFPPFPGNDGTSNNSGMQSRSGTLLGRHCRSRRGTRAASKPDASCLASFL
jgi:hypothetical protein